MRRVTGGTVPAAIWKEFMSQATAKDAVRALPMLEDEVTVAAATEAERSPFFEFLSTVLPGF